MYLLWEECLVPLMLPLYPHHLQTPTFSLIALTTLSSPLFHLAMALFPSKVSTIQAALLTLTLITTLVLNVCTSCSKCPNYRFVV